MKQKDDIIGHLDGKAAKFEKEKEDLKDEMNQKIKEIGKFMVENEEKECIESYGSLADEIKASKRSQLSLETPVIEENVEISTCNHCDLTLESKSKLREHIDMFHAEQSSQKQNMHNKLANLEKEISEQKVSLTSSCFVLKTQEIEKRKVCNCRINKKEHQYCKINHHKHNFVQSRSDEYFSKLGNISACKNSTNEREHFEFGARRKIFTCNQCERVFNKQGHLKKHKKNEHRERK